MALTAVLTTRPTYADPGEILESPAPTPGVAQGVPQSPVRAGDAAVAEQTGAFTYSYPITVPPSRNGTAPKLALTYSSQSPIYGDIAAGWSLNLPVIKRDPEVSVLRGNDPQYITTLGGNYPLVAVAETPFATGIAYRADLDTSFTRYQREPSASYYWRAFALDGTTYYFGQTDSAHMGTCTTFSKDWAPLTESVDEYGNEVHYYYSGTSIPGECEVQSIAYGQNAANSYATALATVTFHYATAPNCDGVPVGQQTDTRTGTKQVYGAQQLSSITVTAQATDNFTRTISLSYDATAASCSVAAGAYRALTQISETVNDTDPWKGLAHNVTLPAVTFTYGSATPSMSLSNVSPHWQPQLGPYGTTYDERNLGWGYRFQPSGDREWSTVEAEMIDVDGDGLVDRLTSYPIVDASGHIQTCGAKWTRNLGNGSFTTPIAFPLPTLPWASATPFTDGGYANEDTTHYHSEKCALNYQETWYHNGSSGYGVCPDATACGANGLCADNSDCMPPGHTYVKGPPTFLAYRWLDIDGDGRVELVASLAGSDSTVYDPIEGLLLGAPVEPLRFGSLPGMACPTQYGTSTASNVGSGFTMCHGLYPWFVYKFHPSTGTFGVASGSWSPQPDETLLEPVSLETASGDSSVVGSPVAETSGLVDLDGDGDLDAVSATSTPWSVWINDGTGQLQPTVSTATAASFAATSGDQLLQYVYAYSPAPENAVQSQGLLDWNGDGLQDHWTNSTSCTGELNGQTAFRTPAELSSTIAPANNGSLNSISGIPGAGGSAYFTTSGDTYATSRSVDVDGDGRQDIVTGSWPIVTSGTVNVNQGAAFHTSTASTGTLISSQAFQRMGVVSSYLSGLYSPSYSWETRADLIDLDGDGLPERYSFGAVMPQGGGNAAVETPNVGTSPPRLLVGIDNHRGATTTVKYASMHSATVTQDASTGRASPRDGWVVSELDTNDAEMLGTPGPTVATYKYLYPVWNQDLRGTWGMRGFQEVDTTLPTNAVRISRYTYMLDWRGLLTSQLLELHTGGTDAAHLGPHTIDDTSWSDLSLYCSGTAPCVHAYEPHVVDHFVCEGLTGATAESTCRATFTGHTETDYSWDKIGSSVGSAEGRAWVETGIARKVGGAYVDGDRSSLTAFQMNADTFYRAVPTSTVQSVYASGAWSTYAENDFTYGSDLRKPSSTTVKADATHSSVTNYTYDGYGNPATVRRPRQATLSTSYTYDARHLFLASETDELGDVLSYTWDYGNGAQLSITGPNQRTCTTGCTTDILHPVYEEQHSIVDGLGRQVERWDSFSDDGNTYTIEQTATSSYNDASLPTSVTEGELIDFGTSLWSSKTTTYDGQGRARDVTVAVSGSAPANPVTSYYYDSADRLVTAKVPDPSINTSGTVSYAYSYDEAGRPLTFSRPDGTGATFSYPLLQETTSDVVGSAGGAVATVTRTSDRWGRLASVKETSAATWTYAYDPNDNLASITEPDGATSVMTYDWQSHRLSTTRGTKTWAWTYDLDGNQVTAQTPSPNPAVDAAYYITTTTYDALDRKATTIPAPRAMAAGDIALFGLAKETFTWDYGANRKSRLRYWTADQNTSGTHAFIYDAANDTQGNITVLNQTLVAAGFNLTREVAHTYYAFGGERTTTFYDSVGGTNKTNATQYYDARGLPAHVDVTRTSEASFTPLLTDTQNIAGKPILARKDFLSTDPMPWVQSAWTYDQLGRVASQAVTKGPGTGTTVTSQALAYYGFDAPKTLATTLGTSTHSYAFGYDTQHQLDEVTETNNAFYGSYSYTPKGDLSSISETWASQLPNTTVYPRDMTYTYDTGSPDEVVALDDGTPEASYTYDAIGNRATASDLDGDRFVYTYDGEDRLRRVMLVNNVGASMGSEEYWYDLGNRRTAILRRNAAGTPTELVLFNGPTEADYDNTGTLTQVTSTISLGGAPVAQIVRTGNTSTALQFEFHGYTSNTLAVVQQNGTIGSSFDYAPFGELVTATDGGELADQRRRFNDKYDDAFSKLMAYGSRYYDPQSMTWTQPDPAAIATPALHLDSPRHTKLYGFCLNNPLLYVDPDGKDSFAIHYTEPTDESALIATQAAYTNRTIQDRGAAALQIAADVATEYNITIEGTGASGAARDPHVQFRVPGNIANLGNEEAIDLDPATMYGQAGLSRAGMAFLAATIVRLEVEKHAKGSSWEKEHAGYEAAKAFLKHTGWFLSVLSGELDEQESMSHALFDPPDWGKLEQDTAKKTDYRLPSFSLWGIIDPNPQFSGPYKGTPYKPLMPDTSRTPDRPF